MLATIEKPDYRRVKSEVQTILATYGLEEPPVDPVKIARDRGVKVFFVRFDDGHSNISGFYDCDENTIFVNTDESPLRQTFTVAHELGHKILHEEWAKSEEYKLLFRDSSLTDNDKYEKEANAFAANLLVPRKMLDKYWQTTTVEQLSQMFAVSVPVIKFRLAFEYGV